MDAYEFNDTREDITSVRVAYSSLSPFVEIRNENGTEVVDGFMPAIVRAIIQWMKLNVTWIHEPKDMYGVWNGSDFSGMLGMLHRNEVDFIVNPLFPNNNVLQIADFMNPIIYEAFTTLSGRETKDGGLFLYFSVLDSLVWCTIGVALLIITFASTLLFLRVSNRSYPCLLALAEYAWVYIAFMLRQGPNSKWMLRKKKAPISILMPFIMTMWMIGVSFLIMTVFQSLLVSKLAIVRNYPIVDSLYDFVSKKNVVGWAAKEIEIQLALEGSNISVYEDTWIKLKPDLVTSRVIFTDKSLESVAEGGHCIYHGHLVLRTVLSDYFKRKGRCNFHLSDNVFYPFPLLMAIRKSLPKKFKEKFNLGVTRLVEADISGKWFKTIFDVCRSCVTYSEVDLKPLSMKHVLGVLVIWAFGMSSAVASVIAENIYFFYCHRNTPSLKRKKNHI